MATPTRGIDSEGTLTATPLPALLQLPSPTPTENAEAEPVTPTEQSPTQSEQQRQSLPLPLYFLGDQAIWLLEPGDTIVEQVTPDGQGIISFDVWFGDGRIAYGTSGGQLYVMMPGQEPRLLHDVNVDAPYPPMIESVSWSPDGTQLAYTVDYDADQAWQEAGFPSHPSGLWLLNVEEANPTWLLSNRYLNAGETDVNGLRKFWDPVWAPDGTALILTGQCWEWSAIHLLDPIAPEEANLYRTPGGWINASWGSDSQSILLSGYMYPSYGGLDQMDRASRELTQLLDGESEEHWVWAAWELPPGIVLLAGREARLYLGHWDDDGFGYSPVGPDVLCDSGSPIDVEWNATGEWGALLCGGSGPDINEHDMVHIVSLDGTNINISSYLSPLADVRYPKMLWGE